VEKVPTIGKHLRTQI